MNAKTVVVMDEAGMADTRRLAILTELTGRGESKLVLIGDQAQLPPIGAGGMFAALQERVPTADLTEVHRARHAWEREAWSQIREGESHHALAGYQAHERLHISDTRPEAAERMVSDWASVRRENPEERTVMLMDASNVELDRINALAQEQRALAGELGADRAALPDRAYGLAAGDEVIFTAALYPPGQQRVENGTLGTVADTDGDHGLTIKTHGAKQREVSVDTAEFNDLCLSYAQHVYKAQGRTVDRAFVLTGGWQTDRERAYVALTRARDRTDLYVAREDLGEQGMDTGAIERLGAAMAESHAQAASIATPVVGRGSESGLQFATGVEPETTSGLSPVARAAPPSDSEGGPSTDHHTPSVPFSEPNERGLESEIGRIMQEQDELDRDQDRSLDRDIG